LAVSIDSSVVWSEAGEKEETASTGAFGGSHGTGPNFTCGTATMLAAEVSFKVNLGFRAR